MQLLASQGVAAADEDSLPKGKIPVIHPHNPYYLKWCVALSRNASPGWHGSMCWDGIDVSALLSALLCHIMLLRAACVGMQLIASQSSMCLDAILGGAYFLHVVLVGLHVVEGQLHGALLMLVETWGCMCRNADDIKCQEGGKSQEGGKRGLLVSTCKFCTGPPDPPPTPTPSESV
eukprot:1150221-Pelagomonas_calceolata.AAC.3